MNEKTITEKINDLALSELDHDLRGLAMEAIKFSPTISHSEYLLNRVLTIQMTRNSKMKGFKK